MSHEDDDSTGPVSGASSCPICYEEFRTNDSGVPQEDANETEEQSQVVHVADSEAPLAEEEEEEHVAAPQPTASHEIAPVVDGCHTVLPVTLACEHTFCNGCLLEHVGHAVAAKQLPLACPETNCRQEIANEQLVRLLDQCEQGLADRFHRQHSIAMNPSLIPCTQCDGLVDPSGGPDLTCGVCRHSFCQVHGDTHPALTCAAFAETDQGRQLLQSEQVLNRFTKPCSRCGARLQKATGCDYVICGNCRKDMCYRCGTHEFMTGESFRKCQQCKTTYHGGDCHMSPLLQCLFALVLAVLFLALIAAWPVAAAGAILLTCCCGGCFHCGRNLDGRNLDRRQPARNRPVQAVLAVIVILFLPLFILADGIYQTMSGNEDGFVGSIIPAFDDKANELPVMEVHI